MTPRKIDPATYCIACRHYLQFKCDILGVVDEAKQRLCNRAGYKETHVTYSTVRHYQNRQGDPYEQEKR